MNKKLLILLISVCFGASAVASPFDCISSKSESVRIIAQDGSMEGEEFTISPNPGTSKMQIKLKSVASTTLLTVYDVLAKKILVRELDRLETTIDVSQWNTGVYLIRITTDSKTQTKRFVKQ